MGEYQYDSGMEWNIGGVPSKGGVSNESMSVVMLSDTRRTIFCVGYGWSNLPVWSDETVRIEIIRVGSLR